MQSNSGGLDLVACCKKSMAEHACSNRPLDRLSCHLQVAIWCGALLFLAASISGCTKSSGAVPVHGRISFHGEPLSKGAITFFPATGRPVGAAISQGEYNAELMPGDYTATVDVVPEFPKGFKEGDPLPPPKVVLSDEYTIRTKSTLKATVKAGQNDAD